MSGERFADRTGWPSGPWDNEPDKEEWRHKGLPCLVVRGPSGALCGYVGVLPGHPWHRVDYSEYESIDVSVHGGLTFSSSCQEGGHICHVAQPGEPDDVWWLGFDCCHSGDLAPKHLATEAKMGLRPLSAPWQERYREISYVRREVESLADQVLAAAEVTP